MSKQITEMIEKENKHRERKSCIFQYIKENKMTYGEVERILNEVNETINDFKDIELVDKEVYSMTIKELMYRVRLKINKNYLGYKTFKVLDKDNNVVAHLHTDWFKDSEICAHEGYHLETGD